MSLSKNVRSKFLLVVLLGSSLVVSCSKSAPPVTNDAQPEQQFSSTPPFQTKEPENYRAVRTLISTDAANRSITTKTTIAKLGSLRREETQAGSNSALVFLELPEGRFIVFPQAQLYSNSDETDLQEPPPNDLENSPQRLLHPYPVKTTYQKLGPENISGRNLMKYRVVVNTSVGPSVSTIETTMWIDETLGIPVKSESISGDGSRNTMELSELSTDVDKTLFQLPAGYQKVALSELRRRLASK